MSYPKKALRIRPRRGVASDVPAWDLPAELVNQADNIVFRDGIPQRADSFQEVYDPPSVGPYCLLNIQIDGTNFWIYAGSSAVYAVQSTVHTDITHASGLIANTDVSKFTLDQLNGVPIFNNAADEPQYWDGNVANNFLDLPGWTATETCQILVPHRFHLFALGIDGPGGDFPDQVKWSAAAAPGNVPASWTAAATNEAGSTTLSETPGAIITGANLRDALMIYKNAATYRCDYVDQPEVFAFRPVFVQAGALTRHAVADINGRHLVVTDGDVIVHDGTNINSIVKRRRKRFLFNQLDQDNFDALFVVFNRALNEVWVCFPEAGNSLCTRAMIYDVANDAWGDRELPGIAFGANGIINDTSTDETWDVDSDPWDGDSSTWNEVNFSLATRDLVLADPTTPDFLEVGRGTQSLTSTLAKYSMDFGEPERFKFVKRVHLLIDSETSIDFQIRIGTQTASGGAITWSSPITYNSDDQFVNVMATGRFISIEIQAVTDSPFRITGFDIEAERRGYH